MSALIIDLKNQMVFFPEDIERVKSLIDEKYHIYAILLSHKYYLNTDNIKIKKDCIYLPVFSPKKQDSFTVPFKVYDGLDHTKVRIDSQFPYEKFSILIEDDNWKQNNPDKEYYREINLTKLSDKVLFQSYLDFNYEILYIGQSFGQAGEKTATDRLKSHSTLQKILADCLCDYSGDNIHVLLLNFIQDQIGVKTCCNGYDCIASLKPNFNEQQIVNITEAALIHYFKPKYNKDFITNFPSTKHTSYNQIIDFGCTELVLDLSYLFNAEHFPSMSLFSAKNVITKEKNYVHYRLRDGQTILTQIPFDNDG
jgi:hypothetical protein